MEFLDYNNSVEQLHFQLNNINLEITKHRS